MNIYRNTIIALAIILQFPSNCTAQDEGSSIDMQNIPCDVDMSIRVCRYVAEPSAERKKTILSQLKKFESRYNDGLLAIDLCCSSDIGIMYYFHNHNNKKTFVVFSGYSFELYKKTNEGYKLHEIDNLGSGGYSLKVHPGFTDSIYTYVLTSYNDTDTGVYKIRGVYNQICNGKVEKKYANEGFFRVVKLPTTTQ